LPEALESPGATAK